MHATDQLNAALAGRYRIERTLGSGGMATVYLARDERHDRQVAIKVLKPELAAVLGAERFVVEIKTTAALQHPHILPLFDPGTADGFLYYVMPYIEGETIREKLNRESQFGVDEAIRITREVADALDYAHRHGVIHRDIKPENILLHDGRAMVMDFGIALAVSAAAGGRMTETGLSLGTPHYMSPEQATAEKDLTPRSDIYSLASVLYEMLTGQPPHVAGTAQQVIMKIIAEPARPVTTLRKSVPPHVAAAIDKALEKLAADRFESAKTFSDALVNPAALAGTSVLGRITPPTARARYRDPVVLVLAAIGIVSTFTAAVIGARRLGRSDADERVLAKFTVEVPDSVSVLPGSGPRVAISPDGTQIVYSGTAHSGARMLYLRRLDDPTPQPIRGTEDGTAPSFTPDGASVVFIRRGSGPTERQALVVPAIGGTPREIVHVARGGVSWGDGDHILVSSDDSLLSVSPDGGTQHLLMTADSARGVGSIGWPHVLPGGSYALITYWRRPVRTTAALDGARIGIVSTTDGTFADLGIEGTMPRYAEPGYIIFGRFGGEIYAAPFSIVRRQVTGAPVRILQGVQVTPTGAVVSLGVSRNGTLVYVTGAAPLRRVMHMVIVDQKGVEHQLTRDAADYESPRVSPDGRHIAVSIGGSTADGAGSSGVWIYDVADGASSRLSTDSNSFRPEWTRDGSEVYFRQQLANAAIVWSRPWNASTPPRTVARGPADSYYEISLGPARTFAAIRHSTSGPTAEMKTNILLAPVDSLEAARPLFSRVASIVNPKVSPNGKLLAYVSNEGERAQVYVTPIPGPGPRVQVSVDGGVEPAWSSNGAKLFYRAGPEGAGRMMAATIAERPDLAVTRRDSLFVDNYVRNIVHSAFDVFPDGRLLMTRLVSQSAKGPELFAIVNWQGLLPKSSGRPSR